MFLAVGCRSRAIDPINPLTAEEVNQVEKRIKDLKVGISPDQVMSTLGLTSYSDYIGDMAGGSPNCFYVTYQLRSDCNLVLFFDFSTGKPGKFIRAELWRSQQKQPNPALQPTATRAYARASAAELYRWM